METAYESHCSVRGMVVEWLIMRGYDGLCNPELRCGCPLQDLMPCEHPEYDCVAAHKELQPDGDWLMVPGKANKENEVWMDKNETWILPKR